MAGAVSCREMFSKGTPALSELAGFDVIFLSAITLAILPRSMRANLIAACGAARDQGRKVVFESNYRSALWNSAEEARETMDLMWANCSIALPSLDDEQDLYPDLDADQIIKRIAAFGVDEVVLKSGALGPKTWPMKAAATFPRSDEVIDSTGAGGSFDAGYLAASLAGRNQIQSASLGHNLARKILASPGAIIPVGTD